MQINSQKNFNDKTAFGQIKLGSGAEYALKSVLKPKDWTTFRDIIYAQNNNKTVDIILFGRDGFMKPYIDGRLVPRGNPFFAKSRDYSQGFFESGISFIKKLSKKADSATEKILEMQKINPDEILDMAAEYKSHPPDFIG